MVWRRTSWHVDWDGYPTCPDFYFSWPQKKNWLKRLIPTYNKAAW